MNDQKLGKYNIQREIGRGAMGVVYMGFDPVIERQVAIKTMNAEAFQDEEQKQRFLREARSAGALQHPNIVTIYEMGIDGETPYIVMEYVEGQDLAAHIRDDDLSIEQKLNIISQLCDALQYAHGKGIIHRDIKPANIRILPDGTVKIMDFGIAKKQDADFTRTGLVVGTLSYMSPEQVQGKPLDPRSDQFSVGVVFYQLLTGKKPFGGDNITNVVYQIISFRPDELEVAGAPTVLTKVIQKMMAPDPNNRFPECGAVSLVLRQEARYLRGEGEEPTVLLDTEEKAEDRTVSEKLPPVPGTQAAPPPPPPPGPPVGTGTGSKKGTLVVVFVLVVVLLGVLGGGGYWLWKSGRLPGFSPQETTRTGNESETTSGQFHPQKRQVDLRTQIADTLTKAGEQDKIALLSFHADWSVPSKELDRLVLNQDAVNTAVEEAAIPLRISLNRQGPPVKEIQERFRITSVPTVLFLNAAGEEIDRITTVPTPEAFIERLRTLSSGEAMLSESKQKTPDNGAEPARLTDKKPISGPEKETSSRTEPVPESSASATQVKTSVQTETTSSPRRTETSQPPSETHVFKKEGQVKQVLAVDGILGSMHDELQTFRTRVDRMPARDRIARSNREMNMGRNAVSKRQFRKAAIHFWRCTELKPDDEHGYAWLVATLVDLKAYEDARRVLEKAHKNGISTSQLEQNIRFRTAYQQLKMH